MALLDKNLTEYYITKQYWDFGGGKIYDKNQNLIGNISNKLFSINKRFEIRDKDNKLLAYIQKKSLSFRKRQIIKDKENNTLYTVVRKKSLLKSTKYFLKDDNGNYQYVAIGKDFPNSYEIINNFKGKTVAKIGKRDKKLLAFKMLDPDENFLTLITMVISIENILNTTFLLSDIAGYGRLVMRLRPFGPGIREKI